MHLITIRTACFTQQKERGLYQNKVNSSLAAIQRPGHQADNCKLVYFNVYMYVQNKTILKETMKPKPNRILSLPWNPQREKTSGNHLLRRNKATSLTSPIYMLLYHHLAF